MKERITSIQDRALSEVASSEDLDALNQVKVAYLGRKGELTAILRSVGSLSESERPVIGKLAGEAKRSIAEAIQAKNVELEAKQFRTSEKYFDTTLPGRRPLLGRKHPLTQVTEEMIDIFHGMGFFVADGPEVETEYYNFDALNMPPDHPARDLRDTFYLGGNTLLRTETSPVQIRTMESMSPPVRMICPGRVYRNDTPDATHSPIFHQVEGLYVDRNVSFADLKGVIAAFARQMMGPRAQVRFRPHFFPFTEPSLEYDFSCVICEGKGCRACKGSGWLEIAGAGMVDPEVFKFVGYDPDVYSGYAFGMGIERIAMIKYGIDDIRLFLENDLRFLEQF
jgi:phenylalanyl-tRNA synthetase alpha chain